LALQALESQLSKLEEEKMKLLLEINEYKSTVQTLKEELLESQNKTSHSEKEKSSLQEILKSEELIREKVMNELVIFVVQ
jgi:phage gp29-like protein